MKHIHFPKIILMIILLGIFILTYAIYEIHVTVSDNHPASTHNGVVKAKFVGYPYIDPSYIYNGSGTYNFDTNNVSNYAYAYASEWGYYDEDTVPTTGFHTYITLYIDISEPGDPPEED